MLAVTDMQFHEGRIVEQRPILVLIFRTQQTFVIRNTATNEVVEGGESNIYNVHYIAAIGRNEEMNEWQVEEIHMAGRAETSF